MNIEGVLYTLLAIGATVFLTYILSKISRRKKRRLCIASDDDPRADGCALLRA